MSKQPLRILQVLFAAVLAFAAVAAQAADDFPGTKTDRLTHNVQVKVDSLFEKGDYERAYFIYREELVPIGDKYAQYMVGYMTLVGKGVARDLIGGSAWYRLAAERGEVAFTQANNEIWQQLNEEQRRQSEQRYLELRLDYSDAMIVAKLIEKDLDVLDSRAAAASVQRDLVGARFYNVDEPVERDAEVVERIKQRLGFLAKASETPDLLAAEEIRRIEQVEARAHQSLQRFEPAN